MRPFAFIRTLTITVSILWGICGRADVSSEGTLVQTPEKIEDVDKEDGRILQRHLPFYFAYGRPSSKLQLSLKTPILRTQPLYFAYTQLMFWDLEAESKPFHDLTYNPELFYRYSTHDWGAIKSLDFGLWSHTSNGKKGGDSRSLNKNFIRANTEWKGRKWTTRGGLQLSYLHGFDPTNTDIQKYIGPLSLSITFIQLFDSWVDKSEVAFQASPGGKFADRWDRGGYQLSWSFRFGGLQLVPAFYLQYYRGYAETLLNYNDKVSEFRGGVIF
jgi:outer membrane phospholipase A